MTRILVRAPNWVGDSIMSTPAIAFLRGAFPSAGIIVMGRRHLSDIFRGNPHVSGFVAADDRQMDAETRAGIIASKFDAVALMPNSFRSAWVARRLGIPRRIGYSRNGRRLLLTHPIPFDPYEWQTPAVKPLGNRALKPIPASRPGPWNRPPKHMVHYYMRIAERTAEALGSDARAGSLPRASMPLVLPVDPEARKEVDTLLVEAGLQGCRLLGVAMASANSPAKRWPAERFAEACDRLADEMGAAVVSLAYEREAAEAAAVARMMRHPLHRIGEKITLAGLIALVDRLDLLITHDSGAMHIAAARETPTVAVFGPTDWNVTYPWSRRAEVVRVSPECAPCILDHCPIDHRCMTNVTAELVVDAARRLLSPSDRRPEVAGGR
ncbi:MAG: glycosyltransferase family 9 protein [Candidatus Sumerlaeaceae bacterium]|nr:glycosyltransferase family 9 protein [Candidatus Sumerlaeaceae bacterium]